MNTSVTCMIAMCMFDVDDGGVGTGQPTAARSKQ